MVETIEDCLDKAYHTILFQKFSDQGLTLEEIAKLLDITLTEVAILAYASTGIKFPKTTKQQCICAHSFLIQGCTCGYKGNNDNA